MAFFEAIDPTDEQHKTYNRSIARALKAMSRSTRGSRILNTLRDNDIQLGSLTPGQAFGYYLAYDRALYTRTESLAQTIQVMAHEGRHAEQTIAGFSTVTEYHKPSTRLPYDTRSYLTLNRVLEADADATALAVMWEIAQADPEFQKEWDRLYTDEHFGPMAKNFLKAVTNSGYPADDRRAVQAGMKAAFQTWPTVGEPLRSDGYDDYMLAWLETQGAKWEAPVLANARLTMGDMAKITSVGEAEPYWTPQDDPTTRARFEHLEPTLSERLDAMDQQLIPAETGLVIDATMLKEWQSKRRRPAPAATPPAPSL